MTCSIFFNVNAVVSCHLVASSQYCFLCIAIVIHLDSLIPISLCVLANLIKSNLLVHIQARMCTYNFHYSMWPWSRFNLCRCHLIRAITFLCRRRMCDENRFFHHQWKLFKVHLFLCILFLLSLKKKADIDENDNNHPQREKTHRTSVCLTNQMIPPQLLLRKIGFGSWFPPRSDTFLL